MGQIKVSKKNHMVTVKVKNHTEEQLNVPLAQWLLANNINGLIAGSVERRSNDKFSVIYEVSDGQTLQDYLKNVLDHHAFTILCESLIDTLSSLSNYNLSYSNILLDLNTIIVRPATGRVEFLYYPVSDYSNHKYVHALLMEILSHLKSPQNENQNYIMELRQLIQGPNPLSWNVLKEYVQHLQSQEMQYAQNVQPQQQMNLRMQAKNSQMPVQNPQMSVQNSQVSDQNAQIGNLFMQNMGTQGAQQVVPPLSQEKQEQNQEQTQGRRCSRCGSINQTDSVFCENCGNLLTQTEPEPQDCAPDWMDSKQADQNANNPYISDVHSEVHSELHQFMNQESSDDVGETTVLGAQPEEEDDATTVLSSSTVRVYPYLVRNKTQEKIILNKDSFMVGKSKTCDYMITGNSAISRRHATFLYEDGNYYIMDADSTNGTSLNGNRVLPEVRTPVGNHYVIRLADEDFQFCLDQ